MDQRLRAGVAARRDPVYNSNAKPAETTAPNGCNRRFRHRQSDDGSDHPAGTFVGNLAGWRLTFGLLSVIALPLLGWIIAKVRDFAGEGNDCSGLGRI